MPDAQRVCAKCGGHYDPDVIFCPKDGTPLGHRKTEVAEDPYVGLTVNGQFQIQQLVGVGAMGRVYRAHQHGIGRDVAIKILHRDLLRNSTVMSRFHREARVASRLVHPNVVQVLMTGELERTGTDVGGEAYLVMEFLDGISLRSALAAAGGALALPRALHILLQACDAVGEAHSQGIVHRDLKPENVMLVRRGDDKDFAKVLDFGVARADFADGSLATQAGVVFGTARYVSPEGAQGEAVGAPGDVYSLATLLFRCLAGQTPFDGDNPVSILIKHTNEEPPDIRTIARSSYVPAPLARVIAQNLSKQIEQRAQDARALGRALARAARESGLSPDDLVLRSTLLGDADGALQLASIERTKAMNWPATVVGDPPSPSDRRSGDPALGDGSNEHGHSAGPSAAEASVKVEEALGNAEPSAAEASVKVEEAQGNAEPAAGSKEAEANPRRSTQGPTRASFPNAGAAEPLATHIGGFAPAPSEQHATSSAPDGDAVDPTLNDEPIERLSGMPQSVSTSDTTWSAPAAQTPSPAPRTAAPTSQTPSLEPHQAPTSSWPPEQPSPPESRSSWASGTAPILIGCFLLSAAMVLGLAYHFGIFETQKEPTVAELVERAERAMAAEAWDKPPGENVKDITDAALERWPGAKPVLRVRRMAAQTLADRAQKLQDSQEERSTRLARLAAELDPNNRNALALLRQGDGPATSPRSAEPASLEAEATNAEKGAPASTAPASHPRPKSVPKRDPTPLNQPADSTEETAEPTPPAPPPPPDNTEPEPSGGRWL